MPGKAKKAKTEGSDSQPVITKLFTTVCMQSMKTTCLCVEQDETWIDYDWDLHASACHFRIFCRFVDYFNMFLARLFRCREDWSTLVNNRDFATP